MGWHPAERWAGERRVQLRAARSGHSAGGPRRRAALAPLQGWRASRPTCKGIPVRLWASNTSGASLGGTECAFPRFGSISDRLAIPKTLQLSHKDA